MREPEPALEQVVSAALGCGSGPPCDQSVERPRDHVPVPSVCARYVHGREHGRARALGVERCHNVGADLPVRRYPCDKAPCSSVKSRSERAPNAAIVRQGHEPHARVALCQLAHTVERLISAAIVDQHQLEAYGGAIQRRRELAYDRADTQRFVVRDHDAAELDWRGRVHWLARISGLERKGQAVGAPEPHPGWYRVSP